jgi:uncharacterized protein YodC (DUF2158 family)
MTTFQPGNKVRHKSGTGYNMAVVEIDADNNVHCQGYSGKKWETGIFNPVTLELVPDPPNKLTIEFVSPRCPQCGFVPAPATETGSLDLALRHLSVKQLVAVKKEAARIKGTGQKMTIEDGPGQKITIGDGTGQKITIDYDGNVVPNDPD